MPRNFSCEFVRFAYNPHYVPGFPKPWFHTKIPLTGGLSRIFSSLFPVSKRIWNCFFREVASQLNRHLREYREHIEEHCTSLGLVKLSTHVDLGSCLSKSKCPCVAGSMGWTEVCRCFNCGKIIQARADPNPSPKRKPLSEIGRPSLYISS